MADSWGKVYVFNATGENVAAYFNDPTRNHFIAMRARNTPPYLASSVPVQRGLDGDKHGTFWDNTMVTFQDEAGAWVAEYNAIVVPNANDENDPVSNSDDLVLYVFRKWVVLYDTHGFRLETFPADNYVPTG